MFVDGCNQLMIKEVQENNEGLDQDKLDTVIKNLTLAETQNIRQFKTNMRRMNDLQRWIKSLEHIGNTVLAESIQIQSGTTAENPGSKTKRSKRKGYFDKESKPDKMSNKEKSEYREQVIMEAAPILSTLVAKNKDTHSVCHSHLRNQTAGEEGTFNSYCRNKVVRAIEESDTNKGKAKDIEKLQIVSCRGMYEKDRPGEHKYDKPSNVPRPMMSQFLKLSCKNCKGVCIIVVKGNSKPDHGIWVGHGNPPKGRHIDQCPYDGDRDSASLKKRDTLLRKWNAKIEHGNTTYMPMSEVDSLVNEHRPDGYLIAQRAEIPESGRVKFFSYEPIGSVKAALSIAPYDEARYNNEGLSPSKLWEQEYMVFHASDPNKAVRLNMKDIQLADDQ